MLVFYGFLWFTMVCYGLLWFDMVSIGFLYGFDSDNNGIMLGYTVCIYIYTLWQTITENYGTSPFLMGKLTIHGHFQ